MSPRPRAAGFGGPSPRSRWTVPCWVPAGTRIRFVPLSVGTSIVPPRDRLGDRDRHRHLEVAVVEPLEDGRGATRVVT